MDVPTSVRLRHSTRRYSDRVVNEQVLEHLLAFAAAAEHLTWPGVRVALVCGREQVAGVLARYAGIYGLVQGAPHLLTGLLPEETDLARLDLGYVLEQVVLEATRLGLATCWITGSYHPDQATRVVRMAPGEIVAAVAALGYPRPDRWARLHDRVARRLAGGHRRRPLETLVHAGRWGQPWSPQQADPAMVEILECARLAPSAGNAQPWRFVMRTGELTLALVEPAPIDGGIVMAHVALAAADLGLPGRWTIRLGDPELAAALSLPMPVVPVGTFSFG